MISSHVMQFGKLLHLWKNEYKAKIYFNITMKIVRPNISPERVTGNLEVLRLRFETKSLHFTLWRQEQTARQKKKKKCFFKFIPKGQLVCRSPAFSSPSPSLPSSLSLFPRVCLFLHPHLSSFPITMLNLNNHLFAADCVE